jgi:hypothetical protein
MIDVAKLQMRGSFGIAVGSAVQDQVLLNVAQEFDNGVMRKLLSLSPKELSARLGNDAQAGGKVDSVLVATKVDGEGSYVFFDAEQTGFEQIFAFSVGGRVRVGFPALEELKAKLIQAGTRKALLRCELCLPLQAQQSAREGVSEVIRISFSGSESDIARLKLVLLDVVMLDGKDMRANQTDFAQNLAIMQQIAGTDTSQRTHCMSAEIVPENAVSAVFERLISERHEGIVVRRLNRAEVWKVKPQRTVDAVVVGFVEHNEDGKFGVASLLTALTYPDAGSEGVLMQTFARVGSGLSDELSVSLLDKLRPLKVAEPIAMTDSSGRSIQFVRPELLIEVHGEDFLSAEAGKPIRTQLVRWNGAKQSYEFLGLTPCPRLVFATFAKLREDKSWQNGGARVEQIGTLATPSGSVENTASAATILRREVYTKGETLRKLLVVHQPSAGEFPYLVYWTDYSGKRAEALKVSLEIAADATRANQLAERALVENLAKGWVKD